MVYTYFFFCPACRADGEVLRSKVWILMVTDPAGFFFCINEVCIRQQVEYLTAKSVDLRFESSWKSTRNFHFACLTSNFLRRSNHNVFLSSASRACDTDIAKCEVWILTWVYPEVCCAMFLRHNRFWTAQHRQLAIVAPLNLSSGSFSRRYCVLRML